MAASDLPISVHPALLALPKVTTAEGPQILEISQVWGATILSTLHIAPGQTVTVGASGSTFLDATLDAPRTLVCWEGGLPMAQLGPDLRGWADRQGAVQPLDGEHSQLLIAAGERLVLQVGPMVYVAGQVPRSRRAVTSWRERLDRPLLATGALVSAIAGFFALSAALAPPPAEASTLELEREVVTLLLQTPRPEPKVAKEKAPAKVDEGARAKKKEGRVGEKLAKMKDAKGDSRKMAQRKLDREVAENSGVLAALRDSAHADVFGSSALSSDLTHGVGSLIGANGTQVGNGGLGSRGDGLGGGGTTGSLGADGLGTRGRSRGDGSYGSGGGDWGGPPVGPQVKRVGEPTLVGPLDRSLIDAVIKRNISQIRYCYQKELQTHPELGGKVVVKFTIAGDGSVSSADIKSSSLGSEVAESCIANRFYGFKFPEPKGGGIVLVSYPFLFAPG